MKILQMHADHIEFKPIEKEISIADEAEKNKAVRLEDILVLFTAVENGDDDQTAVKAVKDAKSFLQQIKLNRLLVYPFAHLSQDLARPADALLVLAKMREEASSLGIETFSAPFGWNKALEIKVKGHPLAEMSRSYGLQKQRPASERAERPLTEHELLSRIKRSDFVGLPETDHRIIGQKLDLFSFQEVSPGMVYWHRKGFILYETLKDFIRVELHKLGYQEISTPALANTRLWEVSGHSTHYKDNMFLTRLGDEEFGLKPMNCPSTFLIYKTKKWSYRDLPVKYSIFDPLFRNELSGVASGLFRVKVLTQDDAHIITTKDKALGGVIEIISLMEKMYSVFNLPFKMKLSTRPYDSMGTQEEWEEATEILKMALQQKNMKWELKEKEGNFYAPKIDVDIQDSLGREWQCATIQVDLQMPKKFKLEYTGEDGKEHTPVVLHRTIYGSLERFIGILLEHFKGKLPLWLSPVQAIVIPVSDRSVKYGKDVESRLLEEKIRVEGDFENATMGAKIRNAQLQKIPYMIVVGEKEESDHSISVRDREGKDRRGVRLDEFIGEIRDREKKFE